jgi:hypothetical protein
MGLGVAIAILVAWIPFFDWIFRYLGTIIHELGHWAAAMLFGYPSVPAFRLDHGGVTHVFTRWWLLLLGVYAFVANVLWQNRGRRPVLAIVGSAFALFVLCAHSGLDRAVILAAGHFSQLLIAGVFLYRGWSGTSLLAAAERPLYAAVGVHMVGVQIAFSFQVLTSAEYRQQYQEKDDGLNDFVRLSEQFGGSMDLWVGLILLAALVVPWASLLVSACRPRWQPWLRRCFQ